MLLNLLGLATLRKVVLRHGASVESRDWNLYVVNGKSERLPKGDT